MFSIEARRAGEEMLRKLPDLLRPISEHFGIRGNSLTLRAIIGREPRTLLAYFDELEGKA